ncbi:transglutaminaseTgpA domain-containing protein [Actinomadura macrotermitis]|uniref:Transglutaminase-like domain-containing protein n=1 Tax=Actinomadura macrotermitis TaxID=2585200 RepID=A0A7K0C9Y5_9ACTN|nr:DUF3488 and transglutaminase-like domain-containing protein [Actinomadura macrotermitis]MQY09574.1 hypothetical protein [Actinomadura macrotermitis]
MNRRLLALPVTACLAAVAGLAFHRVFGFGPVVPVAVVAALVPTALAALLSGVRPWPLWVSAVATVPAWLATAAATVLRPTLGDGSFTRTLREGVLGSWKSILTTLLPAPAEPALLLLVHLVVWLAAFAGAELALRTRLRALPGVPALAAFAVALLLGVDGSGSNLGLAAATVVLLAVLMLLRSAPDEEGRGWRTILAGLPAAAALGALALAVGPFVPVGAEPYNPREQVQAPPPQTRDSVSPLDRVGGWLLSPDQVLFTVRAARREEWRLAVLDRFDGVTWTSGARFVPTGSRVPPSPDEVDRSALPQTITVRGLPGVWAPAADRPRRVDGLGVVVDPGSGVLAAVRPLQPGQTYRVESQTPKWDVEDLESASIADDAEARAALQLPWGPGATKEPVQIAEFRRFAKQATADADSPVQRAAMLAARLRAHARYSVTAPPGHGYRQLDYFLGEGRNGTPEHFATAYAVLARTIGLPTRIKVGFSGGHRVGDVLEVRSGDVMVWPEVKFDGIGWMPFNPTPDRPGKAEQDDSVAEGESRKLEQAQQNAAEKKRAGDGPNDQTPPPAAKPHHEEGDPLPWWAYALAAVAVLIAGYLGAALTAPALRRRRRRAGTPAARIVGAWQQALEHLADVGLGTARTLTAHEVARFGARHVGDDSLAHLRPLADLVDRTRFAQAEADPRAADRAWEHSDGLGRLVTAKAGRLRRLRRRLHPRSLRPRPEPLHGGRAER